MKIVQFAMRTAAPQRRRRLVVDDVLTLSGDEMKAQMADYRYGRGLR